MKVTVYTKEGKESGEITLPKDIFEVPMNADLVHQVFTAQTSNQRQVSAHTKTRGEVRGGGRKPWRQKGTGRARHGSTRSPIWKGGGVSGGPRNDKNFTKEVPVKMKRKALFMVLSQKAQKGSLVVLDEFDAQASKTKQMAKTISKLPGNEFSRLVVSPNNDKKTFLVFRNIAKTGVLEARNLNVVDLLNYNYVVISKDAIKDIETTFVASSKINSPTGGKKIKSGS